MQTIYYIDRYGNIDRTGFRYKKTPTVKIYPVTLTNLIGVYGNFERDSNGDGVADGWYGTLGASLDSGVIGSYSQKKSYVADTNSSWGTFKTLFKIPYTSGDVLFWSFYGKKNTDDPDDPTAYRILYVLSGWDAGEFTNLIIQSETWARYYKKFSLTTDDPLWVEGLYINHSVLTDGCLYEAWVDGMCLYNLTAMGILPPLLQELYEVETWAELPEDVLASLLVYTDSIATIGFTFDDV